MWVARVPGPKLQPKGLLVVPSCLQHDLCCCQVAPEMIFAGLGLLYKVPSNPRVTLTRERQRVRSFSFCARLKLHQTARLHQTAVEKCSLQEMACSRNFEWLVPRAGLSSDHSWVCTNALYNADVAQLLYKVPSNPRVTLTRERQRVGSHSLCTALN